MIKLKDLIDESKLKPKKWMPVPPSELKDFQKVIFDLIDNAYKKIGGAAGFKSNRDVNSEKDFNVFDVDGDSIPDAVVVGKKKQSGEKLVALGHDGSQQAKRAAVGRQIKQLKTKGHYVEVSGRMADIFKSAGVAIVNNEDDVRKVLRGKDIKWHGDGTYDRVIPGIGKQRKTLMGKPKI